MDKAEIMGKILTGEKTLTEFYMYPTGHRGETIAETDDWNGRVHEPKLKNFVTSMLDRAAKEAGTRMDNKIAVKAEVDGLTFPVFFCFKDGHYCIAKEVKQKDNREPVKIYIKISGTN